MSRLSSAGALLALGFCAAVVEAADKPSPSPVGVWEGPGGRIELKAVEGSIVGVMAAPAKGSALTAGSTVFRGAFLEDTLSGQLRLGAFSPGCGASEKTGYALLLLSKSGKLSGSVVTKDPCASKVRSLQLVRAVETPAPAKAPSSDGTMALPDDLDLSLLPATDPERGAMQEALELAKAGRYEQARKIFIEVTGRQPGRGEAYNGVGMTFALRNDWASAIDWYKQGLEHAPAFGDLYFNLACAYAQTNRNDLALRYLRLSAVKGFAQPEMLEDHDLDPLRAVPEFEEIVRLMTPAATP